MNQVDQVSTMQGRPRPPAEHLIALLVWLAFGVFTVAMSIVYFANKAGWARADAGQDARDNFLDADSSALVSSYETGYTFGAFLYLGVAVVVLMLTVVTFRGINAGRLALPPVGLAVLLVSTNSDEPFVATWVFAVAAVVVSVLLFLPRSNTYFATMGLYG